MEGQTSATAAMAAEGSILPAKPPAEEETPLLSSKQALMKEEAKKTTSWMIWFLCLIIVLLVVIIIILLPTSSIFSSGRPSAPVQEPQKEGGSVMYRPVCTVYSSTNKIRVVQTSMSQPDQHWAAQPCTVDSTMFPMQQYGAPDAQLQVDLSKAAHPDREPIMGFGGAFTEASARNYESLSQEGKDTTMELLFGKTGLGYSLGRVHMNSCDFCVRSYNFDGVDNDFNLTDFDHGVQHDARTGMLPMMLRATSVLRQSWTAPGDGDLKIIASPWSPPPWMKAPTKNDPPNATHATTMLGSAEPTCLRDGAGPNSLYAQSWAKYFDEFLTSYSDLGLIVYAITIQNEPEFNAPWEACVYNPPIMGTFLEHHLGPILNKTHPEVKIFIYDHNKDHADIWANYLLNSSSFPYIDGTAIHWYANSGNRLLDGAQGAPNMHRLMQIIKDYNVSEHHLVWATEACHCPSTGYAGGSLNIQWDRAERYAHDILADMAAGANAWIEWNLMLDAIGGPNHLGNSCDSGLLAVPQRAKGASGIPATLPFEHMKDPYGPPIGNERTVAELNAMGMPANLIEKGIVAQPMHYYVGHISRHVRPGSRAVMALANSSKEGRIFRPPGQAVPGGGLNSLAMQDIELTTWPCEGSTRQMFKWNTNKQFEVFGENWLGWPTTSCVRNTPDPNFEGVLLGNCNVTVGESGIFDFVTLPNSAGFEKMNVVLTNGNYSPPDSCLVVKELENNGGALGPHGGAQVTFGACNSTKAIWSFNQSTGELASMFFGQEVCMTTGWPYLQMGAFDTPNGDSEKVVVILNEAKDAANYVLKDGEDILLSGSIPPKSIQTVLVN